MLSPLLSDVALAGALVVVLSLTARHMGLYNLACGSWLVLGGWVYSWAVDGDPHPFRGGLGSIVGVILLVCCQASAPFLLKKMLHDEPATYAFYTLGFGLLISSATPALLLTSSGATIPGGLSPTVAWLSTLAIVVAALALQATRRWAHTVLTLRTSVLPSAWLSLFIIAQLIALMTIGAVTSNVHKGIFSAAEYWTLIPVLSLAAATGRLSRALAISSATVVLAGLLTVMVPALNGNGSALAVGALGVLTIWQSWPLSLVVATRNVSPVEVNAGSLPMTRDPLVGAIVILVLLAAIGAVVVGRDHGALSVAFIMSSAIAAWCARRYIGVTTVVLPAAATGGAYLLAWGRPSGLMVALAVIITAAALSVHLVILRVLARDTALVVDLCVLFVAHRVVLNSTWMSGPNNVMALPEVAAVLGSTHLLGMSIVCSMAAMAMVAIARRTTRGRVVILSLSNLTMAEAHGPPILPLYFAACLGIGIFQGTQGVLYFGARGVLTPDYFDLSFGLMIAFMGRLLEWTGVPLGLVIVFVWSAATTLAAGFGVYSTVGTAVATIVFAIAARRHLGDGRRMWWD